MSRTTRPCEGNTNQLKRDNLVMETAIVLDYNPVNKAGAQGSVLTQVNTWKTEEGCDVYILKNLSTKRSLMT